MAEIETGGKSISGKSGETGIVQYMPETWIEHSKEVLGHVAKQTPETEKYVAKKMIQKWIDEGRTDAQILKKWNQGNFHLPCGSGINEKGVPFNSCAHVQKGLIALKQIQEN